MARIDAGAVATDARWVHPSEIVAAARDQVEHTLQGHRVDVKIDPDVPVRLDPRLTAAATRASARERRPVLAARLDDHVAARASPTKGSSSRCATTVPGIAPADLPHLFERFYRGAAAKARASGTGMGLWIVRGLLAVEARPRLGRELSGRRRAVHDRRARGGEGPESAASRRLVTPNARASCSSTTRPPSSERWRRCCALAATTCEVAGTGAEALEMCRGAAPGSDRAGPRPAGSRGHRGVPAHPRACPRSRSSCCRRAGLRPTR